MQFRKILKNNGYTEKEIKHIYYKMHKKGFTFNDFDEITMRLCDKVVFLKNYSAKYVLEIKLTMKGGKK